VGGGGWAGTYAESNVTLAIFGAELCIVNPLCDMFGRASKPCKRTARETLWLVCRVVCGDDARAVQNSSRFRKIPWDLSSLRTRRAASYRLYAEYGGLAMAGLTISVIWFRTSLAVTRMFRDLGGKGEREMAPVGRQADHGRGALHPHGRPE